MRKRSPMFALFALWIMPLCLYGKPPEATGSGEFRRLQDVFTNAVASIETKFSDKAKDQPAQYLRELDELGKACQQKGELKGVLAVKEERGRFKGTMGEPGADTGSETAELKALKEKFRGMPADLDRQKKQEIDNLVAAYIKHLGALERKLTVQGSIDAAVAVHGELGRLQARPSTPAPQNPSVAEHGQAQQSTAPDATKEPGPANPKTTAETQPPKRAEVAPSPSANTLRLTAKGKPLVSSRFYVAEARPQEEEVLVATGESTAEGTGDFIPNAEISYNLYVISNGCQPYAVKSKKITGPVEVSPVSLPSSTRLVIGERDKALSILDDGKPDIFPVRANQGSPPFQWILKIGESGAMFDNGTKMTTGEFWLKHGELFELRRDGKNVRCKLLSSIARRFIVLECRDSDAVPAQSVKEAHAADTDAPASKLARPVAQGSKPVPGALTGTQKEQEVKIPPGGNYRIDGEYSVPAGTSLEIGPGAVLLFQKGASLSVAGTLNVCGTAEQPVRFSGQASGTGYWKGIVITGKEESRIGYAKIEGAQEGVFISDGKVCVLNVLLTGNGIGVKAHGRNASVTLGNCFISGNKSHGIHINFASVGITDCTVARNDGFGVWGIYYPNANLLRSVVTKNGEGGIYGSQYTGVVTAHDSVVVGNRGTDVLHNCDGEWDFSGCWWGDTNTKKLAKSDTSNLTCITDSLDGKGKGRVKLSDFLTAAPAKCGASLTGVLGKDKAGQQP